MGWHYSNGSSSLGPVEQGELEVKIRSGEVNSDTLLWRKGRETWAPASEIDEFKGHFDSPDVPPPLPGRDEPTPPPIPEVTSDFEPDEPFELETIGHPSVPLAGPWTRFFARHFDAIMWTLVLIIAISYLLPLISVEASFDFVQYSDPRLNALILLPIGLMLNGVVMGITGNSLGKVIFGIKVRPIFGRERFGIGDQISRELTVWLRGMALGIPLFNLYTYWTNYKQVAAGQPAHYDVKNAMVVRTTKRPRLRFALGMLAYVGIFLCLALWNVFAEGDRRSLTQPTAWTNPETGQSTILPTGWYVTPVPNGDGGQIYNFVNVNTGVELIVGVESMDLWGMPITVQQYTSALSTALAQSIDFGPFNANSAGDRSEATGRFVSEGWPVRAVVMLEGNDFWRFIYADTRQQGTDRLAQPEITAAVMQTIE